MQWLTEGDEIKEIYTADFVFSSALPTLLKNLIFFGIKVKKTPELP